MKPAPANFSTAFRRHFACRRNIIASRSECLRRGVPVPEFVRSSDEHFRPLDQVSWPASLALRGLPGLSMPVACTSSFFKELIDNKKFNKQMMTLSPNLRIKYQLTSHVDVSLDGGITQNTIDDQNFFNGLILSDYRNLYKGIINYDPDIRKSVLIAVSYKNPINSFLETCCCRVIGMKVISYLLALS